MVMRVRRTIEIAMSNYTELLGYSVFTYEGKVAVHSDNMDIAEWLPTIMHAWNGHLSEFTMKNLTFLTALNNDREFVAINPEGAISFICGTGKGVWFVAFFAPMDADKSGILRECIQAAKNLETSVSILDI